MKYFTPERFIRLQDLTEEHAARTAMQEWERASEAYAAHLEKLLAELPKDLRLFIESGTLHDARLVAMWQEPRAVLRIVLQREQEASHIVDLNYQLAAQPRIERSTLPESCRSANAVWLYDEIDHEPKASSRSRRRQRSRSKGAAPIFRHHILLSNGWEVRLRFYRLRTHRYPAFQAAVSKPA